MDCIWKFKINARLIASLLLGFSSGLPLALTGTTLQAWYAVAGVNVLTIGLLSLIGQPYVYKFIWAPLFDRFIPPFLGRRRGWILLTQIGLLFGIAGMAFFSPDIQPLTLAVLALIVAFLSASQDIVIDAYRTDLLLSKERGLGAALTITGYRIAMIVAGGFALIMADHYGWRITYLFMSLLMSLGIIITWFSPENASVSLPKNLREAVVKPWHEFMQRPAAYLILIFIILYKLGDAFTVSLSSAFLLSTLHFSLTEVGTLNKILGLIASILGGIGGGFYLVRYSLYRGLLIFGIAQAFGSFLYLGLAIVGKSYSLLIMAIAFENFFSGMSAAAFIAFITGLCDKRYSATQFALFSAIAAVGRVFVGPIAGFIANDFGWTFFFSLSFILSLPSLLLLTYLRSRYDAQLILLR